VADDKKSSDVHHSNTPVHMGMKDKEAQGLAVFLSNQNISRNLMLTFGDVRCGSITSIRAVCIRSADTPRAAT
jgi:hypothetical protein